MKNLRLILDELSNFSTKSKSDAAHFEKLKKLIHAQDYAGAALHISNYKSGLFTSKYHAALLDLLKHYRIASAEDAEMRLKKLILAIKLRDTGKINAALETGSLIVINQALSHDTAIAYPYQADEVPLIAALAEGDIDSIRVLLDNGANFDHAVNINGALNINGETALHLACKLNLPELIVMLLEKGADPNIRDKSGKTPLHTAVSNCDENTLLLLLNKGANPAIHYLYQGNEVSAFVGAYEKKYIHAMKLMIEKGYKLNEHILLHAKKYNPDIYKLLKAPYKARKKAIVSSGNMAVFAPEPNTLTLLHQALYAENKELGNRLIPALDRIYDDDNQILRPLLDLAMLAAEGQHESGVKAGKKLKIILVTNTHVADIQPGFENAGGLYNLKHTIYSGDFKGLLLSTLGTLLHELKHFADQQIYGDVQHPFFESQKDHFMQIKARLEKSSTEYLTQHVPTAAPDDVDVGIYKAIHSIFTNYKPALQNAEILVKVPEIIGYLGVEKGVAWLKKHEPALLAFYIHRFNPACQAYVDKHQPAPSPTTLKK